jgi:hypothetical protein
VVLEDHYRRGGAVGSGPTARAVQLSLVRYLQVRRASAEARGRRVADALAEVRRTQPSSPTG